MAAWNRYATGISLVILLGWGPARADAASKEQRQTTWEGLSAVVGQKVRIVMPDGARIEGQAKRVEADALAVEIHKTSNKAAYPKGIFLVPRATLRAVEIDHPTFRWRAVGLAIGGGLGILSAYFAHASTSGFIRSSTLEGVFAAGAVVLPIGGYLIGRPADRRTITYVIAQ
jgi:hypothetical protein